MRKYPMMQSLPGKALFGAFLFAMLMLARDTLTTSCVLGFERSQFLGLGILCALGLVFLLANRKRLLQIVTDRRMAVILATAAVILIPMAAKRDWQLMYFTILLCPLTAVFLTYFTDVRETARYYVVIFLVLSLHSLLSLLVLKPLVNAGAFSAPVFFNSTRWDFYNFGLSYTVTWSTWYRNFGIFREPGVYQFFLLLALYLNNYKAQWKSPLVLWTMNGVFAVTMVSTFAIGGILELGLFVFFLYFDRQWYKTPLGKRLGIAALVTGTAAVAFVVYKVRQPGSEGTFWFYFQDLYLRLFTGSDSFLDRLDAIFTNVRLFFVHPLFGDTVANVLHGTNHNTSSTLILYAIFGVVGGSLNVAAWIALAWEKRRSILGNLLLLVILFMSFNTQNLVADVFFWLFPYMALTETILGKKA